MKTGRKKKMPNLEKQECHGTRNWQGFPFFFHLKHWYEKKKDKIKYDHRYPTRPFCPCRVTSRRSSLLQSRGKTGSTVPGPKSRPVPGAPRCPTRPPRCSACPAASEVEGQEEWGLRPASLLAVFAWPSCNEQPPWAWTPAQPMSVSSVTLPLDIATVRSSPISF